MSFGGANIDAGWLTGLGPVSSTTTSRIINVGGKIMVVGNTTGDFTVQGFQVRGAGDGGQFVICFDMSGTVQWVQSPVVGLPVPVLSSVVAQDGRGVVNWTTVAASLVTGYNVDVSGAGTYTVSGSGTTSLDVSGLTNAVTYPVKVQSVNGAKQSEYSNSLTVRPMPVPPTPTGLSVATGNKLLDISWSITSNTYVDGYTIDLNGVQYDVSRTAVTRRITGLLTDIPYTVKIRAYNNAYTSSYTASQVVTIPYIPVAPTAYRSIAVGYQTTAAVLADGTVRIWGAGANGKNGIGLNADMSTAVTPCNISNCIAISTDFHTMALISDGTVRTWGHNLNGKLGIATTIDMSTAVTPCNISNCVAVSCANGTSMALLSDGTVRTWGQQSTEGRLGIGSTIDMSTAVTPCNVSNVVAVSCGQNHMGVLLADGTVRTWGGNLFGQLGIQNILDMSRAVTPCNISNCIAISCKANHMGVLLADGTVRTWGRGVVGALGNGLAVDMSTAVTPCNISNVVAIGYGPAATNSVILADGTVRMWGSGTSWQLGNGLKVDMSRAVTPCNISNCIAIANGSFNCTALFADGTIRTWGGGTSGVNGIGTNVDMSTAVTPCNISNVALVRSELNRGTNIVLSDATLRVVTLFNDTGYGFNPGIAPYLGIAVVGAAGTWEYMRDGSSAWTTVSSVTPTSAVLLRGVDMIRGSADTISVKAWNGMSTTGSLTGVDTTVSGATVNGYSFGLSTMTLRPQFTRPKTYQSIAAGTTGTAAVLSDGTVRTWGQNTSGTLGIGTIIDMSTAVTPCNISNCIAIAYNTYNAAALLSDGTVRTWGQGALGRLGVGAVIDMSTAVTPCNISNCVSIVPGGLHMISLISDGTVRTWGQNAYGQLGIRNIIDMSTAVTPCNLSNCVAVTAAAATSFALLADGTVRSWGRNVFGKLGLGIAASIDMSTATVVPNISNCIAISTSTNGYSAALIADGTLRTWGYGAEGSLGIGLTADMSTAVTPCNVSNCVAISCGQSHMVALLADGTIRAWGKGTSGALGISSTIDMSTAVTPCNINNCIAVAVGSNHTAVLLADGTMRTWGLNSTGRLGIGSAIDMSTAVTPCNISNVMIVKPAFKTTSVPIYTNYPLSAMLTDLSAAYQPGTISNRGIAIVGAVGSWEYSVNSGSTWTSLGAVSASSAVALRGSPAVRLRSTVPGTDTITVKAWSTQQATPAVVTTGVDTTVSTATIQGYSFSAGTTIMQSTTQPAPAVPTLVSAVGGDLQITATFSVTSIQFVAGYTVDIGGTTYNVTSSPATITGVGPGTYTVKVRAYNYEGVASAYSTAVSGVIVTISAPTQYRSIAGGFETTAALLADGTMRTWGGGYGGGLGNGSTIDMLTAVTPIGVSNVIAIICGYYHMAALLSDGTLRTWGLGTNGQLGNGSTIDMSRAVTPCNVSNVVAIADGLSYTAALLADGTMRTWGSGANGRLGIGSTADMSRAVTPCNISNAVAIACGYNFTAALLADGTIRTWGNGANGRLGIGSTADMSTAVTPTGISNVVAIACGEHTAVLLADGTMRTWGFGTSGRLGIGSTIDMSTAVTPIGVSNVVAIACGVNTAALLADGTIRTWGQGLYGQLGIGTTIDMSRAVTPTGVSNVVAIAYGVNHMVSLLADGTMRTCGRGYSGQLGINSTIDMSRAVTPTGVSNVAIVKPSFKLSTAPIYNNLPLSTLLLDINNGYQPGTISSRGIAIVGAAGSWEYSVNSGSTWTSLGVVSVSSAVALRGDTAIRFRSTVPGTDTLTVKAWSTQQATPALVTTGVDTTVATATIQGYSFSTGTTTMLSTAQPTPPVPTLATAIGGDTQITATFSVTSIQFVAGYTVDIGGTTYNVTSSPATITGVGPGTYTVKVRAYNYDNVASAYSAAVSGVTVTIRAPITYRSIAGGAAHTAALLADGTMRTWGNGSSGQLGNGSLAQQTTAVTPTGVSNVIAIACGGIHTAALLADGTMRTWGLGSSGQLGIGSTIDMSTAVIPTGVSNVIAISCGFNYTAALLADGTMRTWGAGWNCQLGNGTTTTSQLTAVTPTGVSNVITIACGKYHIAALLADGTMRTWGLGANGQLGNGLTIDMSRAVTPTDVSNVVAIACGEYHTAALLVDGTMRTWGNSGYGQLGNGSTAQQTTAVTPTGVSNVIAISCGGSYTAALLADGTMRAWGEGANGRLGIGSTIDMSTAVTPTGVSNVVAISCGYDYIAALLANGTMQTWGLGSSGQLGIGSTIDMSRAVTPTGVSNVAIVKPSFKIPLTTTVNTTLSNIYFLNISTGYQPGTVPYRGLAVTATTGTWQYSTNSGSSWTTISGVTATAALAIRLETTVRIKCTAAGVLTVKAWSAQQATPATVTSGVDTTVATATIQGYSFAAATTTITAS